MPFNHVDDSVSSILSLSKDGKMMMTGKVSAFDMKLIEPMMRPYMFFPNFLNLGIFKLVLPIMMIPFDFLDVKFPVSMHLMIGFNNLEIHFFCYWLRYFIECRNEN